MGKRLKNYIHFLEGKCTQLLTADERTRLKEDLLVQITFFQHERLIHLIVTVTFALLSILAFFAALVIGELALWGLFLLFLVLLVPYIAHYYRLENGVQRLYQFYDEIRGEQA